MLYQLLISLYVVICVLLVLIIMVQKTKSSMGLGSFGGGSQMLFGGSGGQDVFQKTTWVLGAIFIFGSLTLSIMRSRHSESFRYIGNRTPMATQQVQTNQTPAIPAQEQ